MNDEPVDQMPKGFVKPPMQSGEPTTFGVALDPFKPQDIIQPSGLMQTPPRCPGHEAVFLQAVNQNQVGDILFTCLYEGYEAVYRVLTGKFEPRPGRETEGWVPPLLMPRSEVAKSKTVKPKARVDRKKKGPKPQEAAPSDG